ncbi:MAG TPA: hypothetical protein VIK34_06570 [Clostridiaceae bacterium]
MIKIFNPKNFKDPVAQKTEWTPVFKESNGNFKIKRLSQEGEARIGFKTPASSKAIYRNCALIGLAALAVMLFTKNGSIVIRILALVAAIVGCWGMYMQSQPISFDKASGVFKGGRKQNVKFDDIYALQLITRVVQVKTPPKGQMEKINTYELNLVLNDGSRVNVIAHGGSKEIREDGDTISNFINKPLWDAAV